MKLRTLSLILLLCVGNLIPTFSQNIIQRPSKSKRTNVKKKENKRVKKSSPDAQVLIETVPDKSQIIQNLISNMINVEGDTFLMGSNGPERDEWPIHEEVIASFHIGKFEVTQREWEAIMDNNPSLDKDPLFPVTNVSWDDCQQFIFRLNDITGMNFRLPTEAEWEFAAKGGNHHDDFKYSGGNDIEDVGYCFTPSNDRVSKVGSKAPNSLGIHDMSGNVWEWSADRWSKNYNEPRSSYYFVRRGGSWNEGADYCTVSSRSGIDRTERTNDLGFRIAY